MFFQIIFLCLAATLVAGQDQINNVAFIKLGSYSDNGFHGKDYYIPRVTRLTWSQARSFCNSHGMDILSIDNKFEETYIIDMCERQPELFDVHNYIGGVTTKLASAESWYWVGSGNRIAYPMKWAPGEPNNADGKEWCLVIQNALGIFQMNDHPCDEIPYRFICQQETFEQN